MISHAVEIIGADATAGSILNECKHNGRLLPINPATAILAVNEIETMLENKTL